MWSHFEQAPVSIERLQAMARWFTHASPCVSYAAQRRVTENLPKIQERGHQWIELARKVYGISVADLLLNVDYGQDSALLANLIHVSRKVVHSENWSWSRNVCGLTQFDIRHTLPVLQHDFCTLWNEIVQEARSRVDCLNFVGFLWLIRLPYITLHQGTDAAPTAFSASTVPFDRILDLPSSYPLCNIASHRPDSTTHVPVPNSRAVPLLTQSADSPDASSLHSTSGGSTVSRQVKQASVTAGPPFPTTPSEIGDSSQAPLVTEPALPVRTDPHSTDALPSGAVAVVLQDVLPADALTHPLEGTTQRDIVALCAERDITGEFLSTASASASNPLPPASPVVVFSTPVTLPPSHVPPLYNAELLSLLSGTTLSFPANNVPLRRIRARGLVNNGSTCFVNAVLQLLAYSPPFWILFRELGNLKGLRGAGSPETSGSSTPLVDATVRFFGEFMFKGKELPPTQQLPRQTTGRKPSEDEDAKKEHNAVNSFEPIYMYDAMKEKRQLKNLLDGRQQDAEEFFRLYLNALDEELLALLASEVEPCEVSQTGMEKQGFTGKSIESPLMRIFGGKSRSTVRAPDQSDSTTIEDWRSLQLDVHHDSVHTIEDALARISHLQPVQLASGFSEASQELLIEVLPPILVLHLKRFQYEVAVDGIFKISKPVQFAPELEIPLEIVAPVAGKFVEPVHYKLYGVLYHHGESAGSGHYTVGMLHSDKDSGSGEVWLHIDDEAVSAVQHEDMFGGHGNERIDGQCAYMLFYCRRNPV